jgi:hypothetical protein
MLTSAENEMLTRVSAGQPAGELLRRYWLPVGVACELRVRIGAWHNNLINLETAWGNLPSRSCVIRCWRVTPAYQDTGLVRTYATLFRSGRTVSCIPIAFRTALRLLSSGLPFGESVR